MRKGDLPQRESELVTACYASVWGGLPSAHAPVTERPRISESIVQYPTKTDMRLGSSVATADGSGQTFRVSTSSFSVLVVMISLMMCKAVPH